MFCLTVHPDINNIDNQLDATVTISLTVSISSTCFGQLFAHLQRRETLFFSLRCNAPKFSAGRLDAGTCLCGLCEGCWSSGNIRHTDHISRSPPPRVPADNNLGALYLRLQNTAWRSWRWTNYCPKHFEPIETVNKTVIVASSWLSILFISGCTVKQNIAFLKHSLAFLKMGK